MKRKTLAAAFATLLFTTGAAVASEAPKLPAQSWTFSGMFGTFERSDLQRGFQVYKQICSSCHAAHLLAYRNLTDIGFTPQQVTDFAADFEVEDGPNDEGEMFTRKAVAADRFVKPFPNEAAARAANNGAYPPDLSLMTKARIGGPDYVYALLTGYKEEPPAGFTLMEGMHYNEYFPGHQVAMAPPLSEGGVDYADGTTATVEQMAKDVVTFLSWAAEPEMEVRKRLGVKVMIFLVVLTALLFALKRKIWSDVH